MAELLRKRGNIVLAGVLVAGAAALVVEPVHQSAEAAPEPSPLPFDFDGDGDEELVIGVPGKGFGYGKQPPADQVPDLQYAGWIQVLNGDPADTDPEYTLDQNALASSDRRDDSDLFGYLFVGGDFNGDGYSDLAAGIPFEDLTDSASGIDMVDAGAVQVFYGSATGLQRGQGDFSQFLHRGSAPVGGTLHSRDRFGGALTPGDFDNDGYTDLAIGVPLAELGAIADAGAVDIVFGNENGLGLGARPTQRLERTQWADDAASLDRFGSSLTTGDFDGDGVDDLAIGSQDDGDGGGLGPGFGGGFVEVLYGSSMGISLGSPGPQAIGTTTSFTTQTGDRFGWDLATGDFDNDGDDELAIGSPGYDGREEDGGRVVVFEGSNDGLELGTPENWDQSSADIAGGVEPGDQIGHSLAVGHFDDDAYADLAIGAPGEAIGTVSNAGAVNVIYGSAVGLDPAAAHADQIWHQDTTGIEGGSEPGDQFGKPLVAADYDGDGRADLGVGTHSEDLDTNLLEYDSGSVQVIFGAASALTATGDRQVYPGNGAISYPARGDFFGSGLDGQGLRELWNFPTSGPPSPVRNLVADGGDERIVVDWAAPTDPGGRPITGYDVGWATPGKPSGSAQTTHTDFVIEGLENGVAYEVVVFARWGNTVGALAATTAEPRPALRSISPVRLLETRVGPNLETADGKHEGIGRVAAGSITEVVVAGRGVIPADAVAVMGNLTAVGPEAAGFLTIFACGDDRPTASNVNYGPGAVEPNAVLAPIGDDGKVCIFSRAETDLLLDVNGYVPNGTAPEPTVPIRIYESRIGPGLTTFDGQQQGTGRRPAGSTTKVNVDGRDLGVGTFPTALFINVTAVDPAAAGYLTVHSCDSKRPLASHVNYGPGDVAPNAVLAPLGQAAEFCIFTLAATDLIVDLNGFVPSGEQPAAVTPTRLLETRVGPDNKTVDGEAEGIGRQGARTTYELVVAGRGGVPEHATSVLLNLTAIVPGAAGFLTVFPCGADLPVASHVNYGPGDVAPNAVLAKVGVGGKVCIYTLAETDLIADINGYVG